MTSQNTLVVDALKDLQKHVEKSFGDVQNHIKAMLELAQSLEEPVETVEIPLEIIPEKPLNPACYYAGPLTLTLEELEGLYIRAFVNFHGNKRTAQYKTLTEMASMMGIGRSTLWRKLGDHQISTKDLEVT